MVVTRTESVSVCEHVWVNPAPAARGARTRHRTGVPAMHTSVSVSVDCVRSAWLPTSVAREQPSNRIDHKAHAPRLYRSSRQCDQEGPSYTAGRRRRRPVAGQFVGCWVRRSRLPRGVVARQANSDRAVRDGYAAWFWRSWHQEPDPVASHSSTICACAEFLAGHCSPEWERLVRSLGPINDKLA